MSYMSRSAALTSSRKSFESFHNIELKIGHLMSRESCVERVCFNKRAFMDYELTSMKIAAPLLLFLNVWQIIIQSFCYIYYNACIMYMFRESESEGNRLLSKDVLSVSECAPLRIMSVFIKSSLDENCITWKCTIAISSRSIRNIVAAFFFNFMGSLLIGCIEKAKVKVKIF